MAAKGKMCFDSVVAVLLFIFSHFLEEEHQFSTKELMRGRSKDAFGDVDWGGLSCISISSNGRDMANMSFRKILDSYEEGGFMEQVLGLEKAVGN